MQNINLQHINMLLNMLNNNIKLPNINNTELSKCICNIYSSISETTDIVTNIVNDIKGMCKSDDNISNILPSVIIKILKYKKTIIKNINNVKKTTKTLTDISTDEILKYVVYFTLYNILNISKLNTELLDILYNDIWELIVVDIKTHNSCRCC